MTEKLKAKDFEALEKMFVEAKGRGFQPHSMRAAVIKRALSAGFVVKADSDFFFHRGRGTHLVFTQAGKAALVKRIADRHGMDEDDALHLVRTGNYHLVGAVVQQRRECRDEIGFQTGF